MKKIFTFFILYAVFAVSASALTLPDAVDAFNKFDSPMIDGIRYFAGMMQGFANIAVLFGKVLGVVCIVWNAFRLWLGAEQVKKACADIITKFMIFTALMFTYPYIVDGIITVSISIGQNMGGGQNVTSAFLEFYKKLDMARQDAVGNLDTLIAEYKGKKGVKAISTKTLNILYGTTGEDHSPYVNSVLASHGIAVWDESDEDMKDYKKYKAAAKEFDTKVAEKIVEDYKEKDSKQAIETLEAIKEIFYEDAPKLGERPKDFVAVNPKYTYDPFMPKTAILSPGKIVKTAAIIASIISRKSSVDYAAALQDEEGDGKPKRGFIENTVQSLLHFILQLFMTLGVLMSACFFDIQYIMCLFEYYLVTSIGVIFIPFCLWDGTKSFTAKLVTLFSAYFIKMMVMTLCVFWVFASYIQMGNNIMAEDITIFSFAYFVFTLILGFAVTQNAPQMAVALLNGSPQLSMGEFMQAAGTAAYSAAQAGKVAKATGGATVKTAQGAGKAGATTLAAAQASKQIAESTGQSRGAAFAGVMAGMFKDGIKNTVSKMATGTESMGHKAGVAVGSSIGADGKALTFGEAKTRMLENATSRKGAAASKDKTPVPDTPKSSGSQQPLIISEGSGEQNSAPTSTN
jgi:type IV secretion system protein TrbL